MGDSHPFIQPLLRSTHATLRDFEGSLCREWHGALLSERVHSARMVRTVCGNYAAVISQSDPQRKVLDSNICTKKTASKWVSDEFLAVWIESGLYTAKILMYNI